VDYRLQGGNQPLSDSDLGPRTIREAETLYTDIQKEENTDLTSMPEGSAEEIQRKIAAEERTAADLERVAAVDIPPEGPHDSVGVKKRPGKDDSLYWTYEGNFDRRLRRIADNLKKDAARLKQRLAPVNAAIKDLMKQQKIVEGTTRETNIKRAVRTTRAYLSGITSSRRGKASGRTGGEYSR
jgi:hypothetical protein